MNVFIRIQCQNMISSIQVFLQACELAARKDDGYISKEEQRSLNAIRTAAKAFIKELQFLSSDRL